MPPLLLFSLTGFVAQLVNGSLGMGFGVTSNTVLLSQGIAPAVASASLQMANIGTGLVSGASHWRFGNVSWPLVVRLGVPGAVGGFAGAAVLSSLHGGDWIVSAVAVLLLGLGTVVLVRSSRGDLERRPAGDGNLRRRFVGPLGAVGGFLKAAGGGGWGPVTTPALMASGRVSPRHVIGSVSVAEVLVTVAATTGFLVGLPGTGVDPELVLVMMGGGIVAAPPAAFVVRHIHPGRLGVAVGTGLLVLNVRTLLVEMGVAGPVVLAALAVLILGGVVLSGRTGRAPAPEGSRSVAGQR